MKLLTTFFSLFIFLVFFAASLLAQDSSITTWQTDSSRFYNFESKAMDSSDLSREILLFNMFNSASPFKVDLIHRNVTNGIAEFSYWNGSIIYASGECCDSYGCYPCEDDDFTESAPTLTDDCGR